MQSEIVKTVPCTEKHLEMDKRIMELNLQKEMLMKMKRKDEAEIRTLLLQLRNKSQK